MAIPTTIESLSTTAASNGPSGSDDRNTADDGLRQAYAFIKQLVTLGSNIASASTITPPSTGSVFNITGTTAITTIASTYSWDGRQITLIFAGALTLTHSSNLALPGSVNITTAANDIAVFVQTASGAWRLNNYITAAASPYMTTADPGAVGFWPDVTSGTRIYKVRDRLFVGDGAAHTGNQAAPYGGTALSENVATWPEKNAQAIVGSTNGRIGFLGWTNLSDADTSGTSIAVAGFARAKKASGTSRGFYADVTRESGATAVYGMEVAATNRGSDVTGNAYGVGGGVLGLHLTVEGATGYTLGDADSAATEGTAPATFAVNINAGTGGTANKRWNGGIRFGNNAITGTDGTTGTGKAVEMAKGHELNWMASATVQGAKIRSDVTAVASNDVSLLFANNAIQLTGTGEANIFRALHTTSGVNNLLTRNAATANYPRFEAEGSDTDVGIFYVAKGTAPHRFCAAGSIGNEEFRVGGVATAPVNFLHAKGSNTTAGLATLAAAGGDTDIDIALVPKGSGALKFGTHSAIAAETVTGYITIKDAAGNIRKLAVVS